MITREEQIYLLIGAQDACDRSIRNQMALIKGFFRFLPTPKSVKGIESCIRHSNVRVKLKVERVMLQSPLIYEAVAQFSPERKFACQRDNDISLD